MITTSEAILLLIFNLMAVCMCYYNAAIIQIKENKFSFFWHLLGILNMAYAIRNTIYLLTLLG
jgi:hypothetical protein